MSFTINDGAGESDSDDDDEDDENDEDDEDGDKDLSSVGQQMVQEYMQKVSVYRTGVATVHLYAFPRFTNCCNSKIFAQILTDFRLNRDITSFLDRLVALYGEQRKFLLPGTFIYSLS